MLRQGEIGSDGDPISVHPVSKSLPLSREGAERSEADEGVPLPNHRRTQS